MSTIVCKLAHISDLHFGWPRWPFYFSRPLADHLAEHICEQKPNLIVCTGDVVNSGTAVIQLIRARRFLDAAER